MSRGPSKCSYVEKPFITTSPVYYSYLENEKKYFEKLENDFQLQWKPLNMITLGKAKKL